MQLNAEARWDQGIGSIRTRSRTAIRANFAGRNARLKRRIQQITADAGHEAYEIAYFLCPRDTGFMAEHLELDFSEGGYTWSLGWDEADFIADGQPFYPLYVLFGTVNTPPNDPLFPAHEKVRPRYMRELAAALKEFAGTR